MKVRESSVAAVLAWVTGECWASPWDPVLWPIMHWAILLMTFAIVFTLGVRNSTWRTGTDLSLISIGAMLVASWLWSLWMWHGWFSWDWLGWLAQATGSDGEGAYRMVEFQFFLLIFAVSIGVWLRFPRVPRRDANAL